MFFKYRPCCKRSFRTDPTSTISLAESSDTSASLLQPTQPSRAYCIHVNTRRQKVSSQGRLIRPHMVASNAETDNLELPQYIHLRWRGDITRLHRGHRRTLRLTFPSSSPSARSICLTRRRSSSSVILFFSFKSDHIAIDTSVSRSSRSSRSLTS